MVGTTLSHFRITREIGRGGMGLVYEALDLRLERRVALKVLPLHRVGEEARRRRFLREARAAAAISHPNVAAVHEVGEEANVLFIAMERVEGRTLRDAIRDGPPPLVEALRLGEEIAEGLAAAHARNIVHRDLKPENVLVTSEGQVKLVDFGLAKLLVETTRRDAPSVGENTAFDVLTEVGIVVGTRRYMSPEQAAAGPVDNRSDLYSFGVLLHELVTGRLPEATGSGVTGESSLSPELVRIVEKCLEPKPDDRYQDARDLVVDLRRLRRTGPRARKASVWRRALASRSRLLGGALAALVTGAVVLMAMRDTARQEATTPDRQPRRLTFHPPGYELGGAAISTTGTYLSYSDPGGLHVRHLSSGETRSYPNPPDGPLWHHLQAWSPDGSQILDFALAGRDRYSLWALSVLTGTWRLLAERTDTASLSPDGSRIAFTSEGRDVCQLGWMRADGSHATVILSAPRASECWSNPTWSPDGQRLAFTRDGPMRGGFRERSLVTCDLQGETVSTLLTSPRLYLSPIGVTQPLWLEDGRILYALSEPPPDEKDSSLWALPMEEGRGIPAGNPERLAYLSRLLPFNLRVTRDRTRLSFVGWSHYNPTLVAALDEGGSRLAEPRRLTQDEGDDAPSDWTRDGKSLILSSDRNGSRDVFRHDLESGGVRAIVPGPEREFGARLDPKGQSLIYWSSTAVEGEDGNQRLMTVPLDGGPARTLRVAPARAEFRCARTGSVCLLSSEEPPALAFSRLDPSTGEVEEAFRIELDLRRHYGWDLSPDGRRVALVSSDGELRVLDLEGRVERSSTLAEVEFRRPEVAWAWDGKGMFVAPFHRILFIDEGGGRHDLWQESPARRLAVSPDGGAIAFQSTIRDNDAYLIDPF